MLIITYPENKKVMLVIEFTLNVFILAGLLIVSLGIGFLFRSRQLSALKRKVVDLEKEMLSNHAEILELQKEKAILLRQRESKSSFIAVNTRDEKDNQQDDNIVRMKFLSGESGRNNS